MKRVVPLLNPAGRFGLLWFSLLVNGYFLLFQPRTVFSLRRLVLAALAAFLGALALWLLSKRGMTQTGWRKISSSAWWMGIILATVFFVIAPAPTLHSLIAPVDVRLSFESLDSEETSFQLIWLNNGLGDLSFGELELPPTAEITPEGIWMTARQAQPAEIRWYGRIWRELRVTIHSQMPLRFTAQMGNRIIESTIEGGATERAIHVPHLSTFFYIALYPLMIGVGSLSLAWTGQAIRNGWNWINRRYPTWFACFVQLLPLAALVGVGLFYIATLRSGHPWGDDFAQYIIHGRNLVEGRPYGDIGILQNPAVVLGPNAYPPLLPLLLAPLYAVFGLNLTVFKMVGLICALASLGLLNTWLKDRFQPPLRALAVLLAGLHPWFWEYKDQILSDMPFVLLGMLSLFWWERWRDSKGGVKGWMVGLAMAAAIAARSVGFILLAAVAADAVHHRRWKSRDFLPVPGIPITLIILLNFLLPSTGDYLDQARRWNWLTIQSNISSMRDTFDQFWRTGLLPIGGISLIVLIGVCLLGIGFLSRVRSWGAVEWYFLGTLLMIAIWPYPQGFRFYLPISLFMVYYVLAGWLTVERLLAGRFSRFSSGVVQKGFSFFVLFIFTAGVFRGYLSDYRRIPLQQFEGGIGLPASQQMFAYLREETRAEDVIAFFKPRALTLFTGRTAFAPYWDSQQPQRLLEDLALFGADYLVIWKPAYGDLAAFAHHQSPTLNLIFENEDFEIYSVTDT